MLQPLAFKHGHDYNPATGRFAGNDLLKSWFGVPPEGEIELSAATDVIDGADRDRVIHAISRALSYESGGHYEIDYTIRSPLNPAPMIVRAKGQALFDESRHPVRLSGIVQDITEQKKDKQRKNDFIGMVSHELKTPLTSLTAIIQVLNSKLKTSDDKFVPGALEKASIQVKKMGNMINGFLNVSRLESGKLLIDKTRFTIDQLSREVIADMKLTVTDHQFEFFCSYPVEVFADREEISSVLNNLLSNAVKYSPKGSLVTVNCYAGSDQVQISVKDAGIGISQADQANIFERYFRVKNEQAYMVSGFGIGLYLSAEIIQRHGGKIWVESEPGNGSTFYFSIPPN